MHAERGTGGTRSGKWGPVGVSGGAPSRNPRGDIASRFSVCVLNLRAAAFKALCKSYF